MSPAPRRLLSSRIELSMLKSLFKSALSNSAGRAMATSAAVHGNVTVVTTMHAAGFHKYGRMFVESFLAYWPSNYRLRLYAEGFDFDPGSDRVEVLDLHAEIPALAAFKRNHAAYAVRSGILNGQYDYRFDAVRFSNKAYVLCDAARRVATRFMLWLDADTRTFQHVPGHFIEELLRDGFFLAYLGRFGAHSEAGFLPFDLEAPGATQFFSVLESLYESSELFASREWHDSHLLDCCRTVLGAQGVVKARNLNFHDARHPFVNSAPGLFMDHMKGPQRKEMQKSALKDYLIPPYWRVNFHGGRYAQLPPLLRELLPSTIVEVGTWSGWRAVQMALVSLAAGRDVHYTGYDVFEDFTKEFDEHEMNVKPHFSEKEVHRLLSILADVYPRFSFELKSGNTNATLLHESVDFVFLDGGHSVDTIAHDYDAVRTSDVVLLDDYYSLDIATARFGCNEVLRTVQHALLPVRDPVVGGGTTQFALVCSDANRTESLAALLK